VQRVSWRLVLIVAAGLAGATLTVFVSRGRGQEKPLLVPSSIQGPQVTIGDLTYNVQSVRLLNPNRPADAPYMVNLPSQPKGRAYMGVFLKIYNHSREHDVVSAPGYLLEPVPAPGLVVMNLPSESPYWLDQGGTVPAGGVLPVPGTPAAAGPTAGGMLLYLITSQMTANQPFRLIVHTGTQNGAIVLPRVARLTGGGGH
jgi:hypothetical protein